MNLNSICGNKDRCYIRIKCTVAGLLFFAFAFPALRVNSVSAVALKNDASARPKARAKGHNLSIVQISVEPTQFKIGDRVHVFVKVTNSGTVVEKEVPIQLTVHGVTIDERTITIIAPGQIVETDFTCIISKRKSELIEIAAIIEPIEVKKKPKAKIKKIRYNYVYDAESDVGILYKVEPPVHQWIAFQAYNKLPSADLKSEMSSYLPTSSSDPNYSSSFSPPSGWYSDDDAPYTGSTALIEGAWEEDQGDFIPIIGVAWRYVSHFWDPDGGYDEGLDLSFVGLGQKDSALQTAQTHFYEAISNYNSGNKELAYYYLGRTAHLLMDMTVPAHTLMDVHFPDDDQYENYTASGTNYKDILSSSANTSIPDITGIDPYPLYTPSGFNDDLTKLLYNLTELSDNFDSDDSGEIQYNISIPYGESYEFGQGKYTLARISLNSSKVFDRAEWWGPWPFGKERDLYQYGENGPYIDYDIFDGCGEYHMYVYFSLWDELNNTLDRIRVIYTDGSDNFVTNWDDIYDVPSSVLECIYQPELQARAIGYVGALYQLFWDSVEHPDTDPVLSNPRVNPTSGIEWDTDFEYTIHYYDADGDTPVTGGARVYIDGHGHDMTFDSGSPANGTYIYTTQLPAGSHTYSFAFINEHDFVMTPTYSGPIAGPPGCCIELRVEVTNGPVTNNIEVCFGYGPDLGNLETTCWPASELPQNLWIDSGQQLMFNLHIDCIDHTFVKWVFRDDDGNIVRETAASGYGFILLSGNIHATAYLNYTPQNHTISGTVLQEGSSLVPGGVDLTLSSPVQTLEQHTDNGNFSFTGVKGGVSVTVTPSAPGYAFTLPSLVYPNLCSDHTGESIRAYSSDAYAPTTTFISVSPEVSEESSVYFSWIGHDDTSPVGNLLYQYKLDNVDPDWSAWVSDTSKSYDLENGVYTFWVTAKDEAGNINQAPTNYTFVVNAAPKVASAVRVNRSVWASRLMLEMPVSPSHPNDIFILLPEHSGTSDSELVPVTIHRVDEATACGGNEIVAEELGLPVRITKAELGWLVTLPDSVLPGQSAQYDIVWGKIKYFGWQENVSVPAGFPNGGIVQSAHLDDSLRVWRTSIKDDNKGTGLACDDDGWVYMDMCDKNGIIIPESIMRYVSGECWGGNTGTSTAFYHGRIFDIGTNKCAIWKDEKYEWDGSTDYYYRRYGLQLFDNTGATVGSVDGDYYNRISWSLPKQPVHNKIWLIGDEWGSRSGTPSAFYMVLNSTGGTDIAKTNFDTITGKIYGDLDVTPPAEVGSNVIFAWSRGWETPDYYRRELVYQIRNSSGSIVKSSAVFSGSLYPDSVEEDDEYDINGYLLTDKEGKVWITYERDRSDQPREHYYVIIGSDGNIWKGPIQTTNARSFNYCDKDGYIWATEGSQFFALNPDDTTAVGPRTVAWIPNQDVGSIAASVGSEGYRLYDRWSPQFIEIDVPSGVRANSMELFDLNLWDNELHTADPNLKKVDTPVWSHPGQFTGHTTIDVSGIIDEGYNILTMTQDDFLGGQVLITFPYTIPVIGDITCDGKVNFEDLEVLADQWLQPPGTPSADLAPSPLDNFVNFLDFAVLADNWLAGF